MQGPERRNWFHVDATGIVVGTLAASIVPLLSGKNKPTYQAHKDGGDYVVITNAEKILFTGKKWRTKVYKWHTMWPGGLHQMPVQRMLQDHPERILKKAISGMLPKNGLREGRIQRLKIYIGDQHPHAAQLLNSHHSPHIRWPEPWKPDVLSPDIHKGFIFEVKKIKDGEYDVIATPSKGTNTKFKPERRYLKPIRSKAQKVQMLELLESEEFWKKDPYIIGKEPPIKKPPPRPWKPMEEEIKDLMKKYEEEHGGLMKPVK